MKQRWHEIDICRGIGILLVLYGHALEMSTSGGRIVDGLSFQQWQLIYSFHMPLFFMLSGAVHRGQGLMQAVSAALFLILLAWLSHVAGWILRAGQSLAGTGDAVSWHTLIRPFYTLQWYSTVVVWFLAALALVQILHALLVGEKRPLRLLMLSAGLSAIGWHYMTGRFVLQLGVIVPCLLFFHLGWRFAASRRLKPGLARLPGCGLIAVSVAMLVVVAVAAPLNDGCGFDAFKRCPNTPGGGFAVLLIAGQVGFWPWFALTALAGALCVYALAAWMARWPQARVTGGLMWIGRQSLLLLLLNGFVLAFLQPWLVATFEIGPSPLSSALWTVGLTVAQVAAMPVWRVLAMPMVKVSRGVADALGHRLKRLAGPGGLALGR